MPCTNSYFEHSSAARPHFKVFGRLQAYISGPIFSGLQSRKPQSCTEDTCSNSVITYLPTAAIPNNYTTHKTLPVCSIFHA